MKKLLMCLLCMFILTGCTSNHTRSAIDDQGITPDIIALDDYADNYKYFYVVDKNTHVVYLQFDAVYRSGITVLMDADGKPVLAEDLGIKVD